MALAETWLKGAGVGLPERGPGDGNAVRPVGGHRHDTRRGAKVAVVGAAEVQRKAAADMVRVTAIERARIERVRPGPLRLMTAGEFG